MVDAAYILLDLDASKLNVTSLKSGILSAKANLLLSRKSTALIAPLEALLLD